MNSVYFINLIFIFVLNVFFFFTGICLNSVVIISISRSVQLRKKLCYFMIMVLSCCDLLAVLTNMPLTALLAMLWLTGKLDVNARWPHLLLRSTVASHTFSLFCLLVMNFDRYLATSYPLFHRTSVTKARLLTLLAILIIVDITLAAMSTNDTVISFQVHAIILYVLITPPMLFINYKLFRIVRKSRGNRGIVPEIKKSISMKNVSSCLLAVACFLTLTIPVFVYAGLMINSTRTPLTLNHLSLGFIWSVTIALMNCTSNCLIFFWKSKVLRTEGLKVIKSIKIYRGVQC